MNISLPQSGDLIAIPSDEEIAAVLSGRHGAVRTKNVAFAYTHTGELQGQMQDAVESGSVSLDNTRAALRTAQLSVRPASIPVGFDPLTDFFVLGIDVLFQVTGPYRFQLGIFRLDFPQETHTSRSNELWNVTAMDPTVALIESNFPDAYTLQAGTIITDAVQDLLTLAGQEYSLPASPLALPINKVWPPGTDYLTIINDLLSYINYFPIWCDRFGIFRTRVRIDPSTEERTVTYSTTDDSAKMIVEPWNRSYQVAAQPNRVVAMVNDPLRAPAAAEAINVDVANRASTINRGLTKTREDSIDGVPDDATLLAIAEVRVRDAACAAVISTLMTFPDPRRGEHETYNLTVDTATVGVPWRCQAWTLPLTPGARMTHNLQNASGIEITSGALY